MFDRTVLDAIKLHAIEMYPAESCGAVTPDGYVRLANKAADPTKEFDCADAVEELRQQDRLLAVVHSHPDGPAAPSAADIAGQDAFALPWGLTATDGKYATEPVFWGDQVPMPPLEGRPFRHGPSGTDGAGDCYALVRDWFRSQRGITLMEQPREWEWWLGKGGPEMGDLYMRDFAKAGFVMADPALPEIGDVVLFQLQSPVANHAAVYVGEGLLLHHLQGRLSRKEPFGRWSKFMRAWLRYAGPKNDE